MRTTCTRRWTGCWRAKTSSKTPWLPGIWSMARWCSMTCPRRRSRAAPARWGQSGTPVTGSKAGCRSSTGCCAHRPGSRSRSRCSRATPPTRNPGRPDHQAQNPVRAVPGVPGRGSGHAHQRPHPRRAAPRRSWIGSARCAPRRSKRWSRTARCSCRCSTPGPRSRSAPRTFPASGWCAATTPPWPTSGPANAASCWPPPKKNSPPSPRPPAAPNGRCAAKTRSRYGSAR